MKSAISILAALCSIVAGMYVVSLVISALGYYPATIMASISAGALTTAAISFISSLVIRKLSVAHGDALSLLAEVSSMAGVFAGIWPVLVVILV